MRQPRPENQLTLEEKQEVRAMLDNGRLVSGLRKIFQEEADYWLRALEGEGMGPDPSSALLVQFCARKAQMEKWEALLRKAVGA